MQELIKEIEAAQIKEVTDFNVGDTIKVHAKIVEGNRERIQVFEGLVIKKQGGSNRATFTVRNISIQGNTSNESIQQSSQSTTNNITTDNSNSNTLSASTAQEAGRNAISNGVQNMKDSVTNSMQNNQ